MRQLYLWNDSKAGEPVEPTSQGAGYPPQAISTFLRLRLNRPVRLVLTDNRSTMMTYREEGAGVYVRLHKMFAAAPAEVMEALAEYLATGKRQAGRAVDAFISEQSRALPRKPVTVRVRGRVHHLGNIFEALNARYFHNSCRARITWGRSSGQRRRRSIQLGCYVAEDALIRIHPCLDEPFVPEYYVAWVVFHEMLHEVFGVEAHGGKRRSLHPPEFLAVEQSYPDYQRCKAWEQANLGRLLRYRKA